MPDWHGHDRRAHPRVRFQAQAVLSVGNQPLGGFRVHDLSVGGALLVGAVAVPVGTTVLVRIGAPGLGPLSVSAMVVRTQQHPEGVALGMQFLRPPTTIAAMIEEAVLAELERATKEAARIAP